MTQPPDSNIPGQIAEKDRTTPSRHPSPKTGFFQWLLGAPKGGVSPERFEIRVAKITCGIAEVADAQTRHLVSSLAKCGKLRVRSLNKELPQEQPEPTDKLEAFSELSPAKLEAIATTARQWLNKANADLLIWGNIPPPGTTLHLRFVSAATEEEDKPGLFSLSTTLNLPVDFAPEFAELLLAVAIAATVPRNENKNLGLKTLQENALKAAMVMVKNLPLDLTSRERGTIQMCFANALAIEATRSNSFDFSQIAAQTYRTALENISFDTSPVDWAISQKYLGSVIQTLAERTNDEETLNAAADAFGEAIKVLTKLDFPREWAATQNRLGLVLQKLDVISGDTDLLPHSLNAFQSALQVLSRTETPLLWAEAMNNFAQAAQVLGEQHKNPEVLEKAVKACRSSLEVRKKEKTPMLWAATQNNLGSALFLLGKMNKDLAPLKEAAEAFTKSYDFYTAYGAEKMAAITAKNLSHVERLLDKHSPEKNLSAPKTPPQTSVKMPPRTPPETPLKTPPAKPQKSPDTK